jgi:dTDP-4-dehydrorhamnose reductase
MSGNELPRVLLLGKNGQVGWELQRALAPLARVAALDYPEIDLADNASLRGWMQRVAPEAVVNAAAHTAVDRAETEAELVMKVNGDGPGVLAAECKRLGALLVHYSTDYVFDGRKAEPYLETDAPAPLNVYGRSKLAGERAVEQAGGHYLIFRLCWVYGARGQNFLRTIMRLARERETLRVVCDQRGSPTWSRWVAEATVLALQQALAAPDRGAFRGTYHLTAAGATSWHGFADRIVTAMPAEARRCREVQPISTAEYLTPAQRPAYSVLDCGKLRRVFGLALPAWEEGLRSVLEEVVVK